MSRERKELMKRVAHELRSVMQRYPSRQGRRMALRQAGKYLELQIVTWREYDAVTRALRLDTELGDVEPLT